jgi:hypothetical protein
MIVPVCITQLFMCATSNSFACYNSIQVHYARPNFGWVSRARKDNVWPQLQPKLQKEIISAGCGVHIIYNCPQSTLDCLPFNVGRFAIEMHKYFYIYTLHYKVQRICAFAGLEYAELLHIGTCFIIGTRGYWTFSVVYAPTFIHKKSVLSVQRTVQKSMF